MKKLIINADGYGFTYGNNRGIEEVVQAGVVTSISVNVNFPAIEELPAFINKYPHLSVGVHLNPVVGQPISPIKEISSLVDSKGEFHHHNFTRKLQNGEINLSELQLELSRQVEMGINLGGKNITHLDSHQNRHLFPKFFKVFLKIAKKFGIERMRTHNQMMCVETKNPSFSSLGYYLAHPKRYITSSIARYEMKIAKKNGMRMADRLLSVGHIGSANKAMMKSWNNILINVPEGTNEIFCHPGYVDETLKKYAKYVDEREDELKVLTHPELKAAIIQNGIQLISFHDI